MSDFDRIREEGERISREEGYKVLLAEIAARDAEIERLRLTAVEIAEIELLARLAWQDADDASFVLDIDRARACERRAATLRGLLERLGQSQNQCLSGTR